MDRAGPRADELRDAVDEVALRALIAAYADVVNRRTWPEFGDLFLPDAPITIDLRDREPFALTGPDEIGEFIGDALEQYPFLRVRRAQCPGDAAPRRRP